MPFATRVAHTASAVHVTIGNQLLMETPLLFVLLIAALTQLGGLAGGVLLIWKAHVAQKISTLLLSFAAGTLLGVAFLDLLPETAEAASNIPSVFAFTLLGILCFFVIEKLLLWHHHSTHDDERGNAMGEGYDAHIEPPLVHANKHIRPMILFGDGMHNFLDGVTLATTFSIDWKLGLLTAVAVFFHEVPHNISDFAVLLHTRMPRGKVMLWNVLLTLPSPLGALLAVLAIARIQGLLVPLLAIAAGSFLYIALADLMPEIHHEKRPARILGQIGLLLAGVALLWAFGRLFPEGG